MVLPKTSTTTMSPSLLLTKLPAELRALIWEFTLQVAPTDIDDTHRVVWLTPDPRPRPSVLSLLLVCRQINHEAADIFYHVNQLAVDVAIPGEEGPGPARLSHNVQGSLAHFLKTLSPRRLRSIHSLSIWIGKGYATSETWEFPRQLAANTCIKRVRRLPNLHTVHLMWEQPQSEPRTRTRAECWLPNSVVRALGQLRQVEEVKVWVRGTPQDDPSLAGHAKVCEEILQRCLPKQRAKDDLKKSRDKEEFMLKCRRG
jgi:hypothetical protein